MKGTEHFKDVIQNYLETRASYDELFAESFRKENKNIDECIIHLDGSPKNGVCRSVR